MRLFRLPLGWLAGLAVVAGAPAARAESAPDPLRLVSDQADLFFKVQQPRKLVDSVYHLDVVKQLLKLDAVREFYESTSARRFYQLVAYFERQLGAKWPALIDRLAGGGAVIAAKLGPQPAPVVLVVQGKDAKLLKKFWDLGLTLVGQELARQGSKAKLEKGKHRSIDIIHVGDKFFAALAGSALVLSNHSKAMQSALDLYLDGGKKCVTTLATVAEARKLLPADPLAWGWLNMDPIRKLPQAKVVLAEKQNDVLQTITIGHYLDLARRSPFICLGVYRKENRFLTTIRFPRGREGMPAKFLAFQPPSGSPGSLPLLEPKNVLLSSSYRLDLSQYWEKRKDLFNEKQVQTFEKFDRRSGFFLGGTRFSELTKQAGPYQRFVLVQQTAPGYQTKPVLLFPAGAFVLDMRKPDEFSKGMGSVLRTAALFGGNQFGLKLMEEKRGDCKIVGYRFPEGKGKPAKGPLRNDVNKIRYNFSPCFVRVGNQFVISSTIELARELVDLLQKEAKEPKKNCSDSLSRTRIYASGGVALMKVFRDQLLTQTILGRAVEPEAAEKEIKALMDLVGKLGTLEHEELFTKNSFHYDWVWNLGK
jgi:hypothetical protein